MNTIGLYDVDSHNYPNLALMKISAYHKSKGDNVEFINFLKHYDKIYVSKIFGDEYSKMDNTCLNSNDIVYGGTGFAIKVVNGKECFNKNLHKNLPYEIEHIYPDYSLYTYFKKYKDTAFGFLTRGCCNNCDFCIVSKKEGIRAIKVCNLDEFWKGQKYIELLDANILASKDRLELLDQLIESKSIINFSQGIDARFITEEIALKFQKMKIKSVHFAFDYMKNEKAIIKGLKLFQEINNLPKRNVRVYILTNYNTSIEEDLYRINEIEKCNCIPDIRIYRKKNSSSYSKRFAKMV